jgi:hypothetical protein
MAEQQTTGTEGQQGKAPVGNDVSNYGLEEDPDYALLQQAKQEAEQEENGILPRTNEIPEEGNAPQNADYGSWTGRAPAEGEGGGQTTYEPSKPVEGEQGQDQGSKDQIMVPKARLDEALHKADQASRQATYLQGQLEAYAQYMPQGSQQSGQSSQQPARTQQPDPQQQIQQEEQKLEKAADQYDSGEISLKEYEKVRSQVDEAKWQIREQSLRSQQRPASEWGPADEKVLDEHLNQLASNHPYVDVMTQADYDRLQRIAVAEAEAEGKPIQPGARGTMDLRERVARLTDHYGPQWYPNAEVNAGSQPSQPQGQQTQQRQAQGPNLSPQAQARQDKNALAERLPPDPNDMGTTAQGSQIPNEEQIAQMTDDEIQELPPQIRQRYL